MRNMGKIFLAVVAGLFLTFAATLLYGIFVLPRLNRDTFCIQIVARSCFLGTPMCFEFPNPCLVPPLWFPENR